MTIPALGAPLAPAATGVQPPAQTAADGGAAFARQLQLAARQEPANAPSAPPHASQEAQHAQQQQQQQRAKGRANGERPPAERAAKPATQDADKATATDRADTPTAADETQPGDMSALLAGLLGHAQAAKDAARGEPKAVAATGADAAKVDGADDRRPSRAALAADERAPQLRAHADGEAALPPVRADAATQFTLPQQAQAAAPAADATTRGAAPVYTAQVDAALGTPDFAPGLSAQVTVMLRDGVQEARLQLNPAEMGPITVQIQIDGTSAQVDFSAEQAPTRQALEQALPTLAGALQENGLTLTGGGVFEQPRQPRDAETGDDGAPRRFAVDGVPAAEGPAAAAPARRAVTRGVVDLYA